MTHFVDTDISVDTIVLNWNVHHVVFRRRWKRHIPKDPAKPLRFCTKVNDVDFTYIPRWSLLSASFSASKLVNGCNCYAYQNNQYEELKQKIEDTIRTYIGMELHFEDASVSRLDVFKSIEFQEMSDAEEFIKWLQRFPSIGKQQNYTYNNTGDFRLWRSGLIFKSYLKNRDPALPKKVKKALPPTVRIEIECWKKQRRNLLGKGATAEVLKYPDLWCGLFNAALKKFHLDGVLLTESEYRMTVSNILKSAYPNARFSTLDRRLDMLLDATGTQFALNHRQLVPLIKLVADYGIVPYHLDCANAIPNHTLCGYASITVEEQCFHERNQEILERTLVIFRYCLNLNQQGANTECIIFSSNSYLLVTSQLIILAVAIDDSS